MHDNRHFYLFFLSQRSVKLDLDMKHLINASLYEHKLDFHITIQTRSINRGTKGVVKSLNLVNEVSLSLHGFVLCRHLCFLRK